MPMHRKNKTHRTLGLSLEEPWFKNNVKRQRKRAKIAAASRRKNRRK